MNSIPLSKNGIIFGCKEPESLASIKITSFKEEKRSTVRGNFSPSYSSISFEPNPGNSSVPVQELHLSNTDSFILL